MKRLVSIFLISAMIFSVLTGCGGSTDTTSDTSGTSAEQSGDNAETAETEAQPAKDTLVVAQTADTTTLDPQQQGRLWPDMSILSNIFDTLLTRDENGELAPNLATEWEAIDDYTWQFKLRDDVIFHNGEKFDANSVKFSIERLIDPDFNSPISELRTVKEVNVVDDYTVNIVTSEPDPIIPNKMVVYPGVMMPPEYVTEMGNDYVAKNPVGTGAYKFVSWEKDHEVVLEANEDYWKGAPEFKNLIFRCIPNQADQAAALRTGEVDFVLGISSDVAENLKDEENLTVFSAPSIRTFYIGLDCLSEGPLQDKRVRQAMNYAIDVQGIIDTVLGGNAQRVATIVPQQNFGYDDSIQPYEYNLEKAKELMAEAGYADGFTIDFDADNDFLTEIQAIAGQLEQINITVNINPIDYNTMVSKMLAKEVAPMFMIGIAGWTQDAMSNFQSYIRSDRKYTRFNNPECDEMIDILETSMDPEERQRAISRVQEIISEEAYFIYLWQRDNICVINKNIEYNPNLIGLLNMYSAKWIG